MLKSKKIKQLRNCEQNKENQKFESFYQIPSNIPLKKIEFLSDINQKKTPIKPPRLSKNLK